MSPPRPLPLPPTGRSTRVSRPRGASSAKMSSNSSRRLALQPPDVRALAVAVLELGLRLVVRERLVARILLLGQAEVDERAMPCVAKRHTTESFERKEETPCYGKRSARIAQIARFAQAGGRCPPRGDGSPGVADRGTRAGGRCRSSRPARSASGSLLRAARRSARPGRPDRPRRAPPPRPARRGSSSTRWRAGRGSAAPTPRPSSSTSSKCVGWAQLIM